MESNEKVKIKGVIEGLNFLNNMVTIKLNEEYRAVDLQDIHLKRKEVVILI